MRLVSVLGVLAVSTTLAVTEGDSSRPVRGWLGVVSENLSPAVRVALGVDCGVVVSSVVDSSPAALAGLRVGDIITRVAGERIEDAGDLRHAVRTRPNQVVRVEIVRTGRRQELSARLGTRQDAGLRALGAEQFELEDLDRLQEMIRAAGPVPLPELKGHWRELDSLRVQVELLRQEIEQLRRQLQEQGPSRR